MEQIRGIDSKGKYLYDEDTVRVNDDKIIDKTRTAGTMQEEFEKQKQICAAKLDDDPVHPTHYTSFDPEVDIDCRTAMRAAFGKENVKHGFLQNAFEYIWRSSSKGRNLDIQKAIRELQMFLELGGYE